MASNKEKGSTPTARELALSALNRIEKEASFADLALNSLFNRHPNLDNREKALATELVYGCLRWRLMLDWFLTQISARKKLKLKGPIHNIMRLSLYQLIFLDRIPPRAVINEAVNLAKASGGQSIAGFVNATLRSWERQRGRVDFPDPAEDYGHFLSVFFSEPQWLIDRWRRIWPESELLSILHGLNQPRPLTVRVNTLNSTLAEVLAAIPGSHVSEFAPQAVILPRGSMEKAALLKAKGKIYFQDQGSQLVSHLLSPEPGGTYLDSCAAPGGKSTHMMELMEGKGAVYALDIHAHRAAQIKKTAAQLGTPGIIALKADAEKPQKRLEGISFDGILLDAPCSGSGTLAGNPDLRWRLSPDKIKKLAKTQRALLKQAASMLPPKKPLVYSTCSIDPEEGIDIIKDFLSANDNFILDDPLPHLPEGARRLVQPPGYFYSFRAIDRMDGFFAARLVRTS